MKFVQYEYKCMNQMWFYIFLIPAISLFPVSMMTSRFNFNSVRGQPRSLKNQFRWKLVPRFFWQVLQSFRFTLLIWALVTAGCLFYLSQWMSYRQLAHRVVSLETERSGLEAELELLEVEISYLTRPQRLEVLATKTMHMTSPAPVQYQLSWDNQYRGE